MDFDFNKEGQAYEFMAVPGPSADYGTISKPGAGYLDALQKSISKNWNNSQGSEQAFLGDLMSCIERLTSFLFQCSRIPAHQERICTVIPQMKDAVSVSAVEACVDFESLLFLARAAIDKLTFCIATRIYGQKCDKFQKLINILSNFNKKDKKAAKTTETLNFILPKVKGILINSDDGKTSLRSLLAHRRSFGESITGSFTIHHGDGNRVLRFDHEVCGYPLIGTSWRLNQLISFIILKIVGIYSDYENTITLKDCNPAWKKRFIPLSKYIDDSDKGLKITIPILTHSGVKINNRCLKREVLKLSESISK